MHVCSMTWRKSLLLLTALNPRRYPAQRRIRSSPGSPCGVWSTSQASAAGGGSWERQKFQDWEERWGFAHLQPARHKTDLSSQPWNSSSGAHIIKNWTNCESPLKKIKSSLCVRPRRVPPPRRARTLFGWRGGSPARDRGSLLLEAAWAPRRLQSHAPPAAGVRRGGRHDDTYTVVQSLVSRRTYTSPAMRALAYCGVLGSYLILRA